MLTNRLSVANQKQTYDVIVVGSGAAGSVVARRLSDNPNVKVLLLEAGGFSYPGAIEDAVRWPENIGGSRDWAFHTETEPRLNGRSLLISAGRVVGGNSSINAMIWARGHKEDWDHYAAVSGDPSWGYESILKLYQRIETYHGKMDMPRGVRGRVHVFQPSHPHPIAPALIEAAGALGIPHFANPNGLMMEAKAGAAITDVRANGFERLTVFDSYVRPILGRENLTLIADAAVRKLLVEAGHVVGLEVAHQGKHIEFRATEQIVLSAGAINTPRILLHSGIGDMRELRRLGIPLKQHLPGVGQNLQTHLYFPSIFKLRAAVPARFNGSEATIYATLNGSSASPDVMISQYEFPLGSAELMKKHSVPSATWSLAAGLARPLSRGQVSLRSADPVDPVLVRLNALADPQDLENAIAAVELSREIGEKHALGLLTSHPLLPGKAFNDDPEGPSRPLPRWDVTKCRSSMAIFVCTTYPT